MRCRPSRASELSRAASGLVKVLCKPCDGAAGGEGKQKGKLLKQGSSLANFDVLAFCGSSTYESWLRMSHLSHFCLTSTVKHSPPWFLFVLLFWLFCLLVVFLWFWCLFCECFRVFNFI